MWRMDTTTLSPHPTFFLLLSYFSSPAWATNKMADRALGTSCALWVTLQSGCGGEAVLLPHSSLLSPHTHIDTAGPVPARSGLVRSCWKPGPLFWSLVPQSLDDSHPFTQMQGSLWGCHGLMTVVLVLGEGEARSRVSWAGALREKTGLGRGGLALQSSSAISR